MTSPLLSARNISKSYGQTKILHSVSLDVSAGQTVCLIGPSGAGKSSLLRCLNLLEDYEEGEVYLDGELIGYEKRPSFNLRLKHAALQKQRQQIGFVFQNFNLFAHRTALENVMEGPVHALGKPRDEACADAERYLAMVGLAGLSGRYPHQLSGGQQQRVAIARSLAMTPKVILFDEPTSALDPELVGEVLAVLQTLADSGATMVLVTHEMGFARRAADRIVFMDGGRVVEQGLAEAILDDPQNPRLQGFLSNVLA